MATGLSYDQALVEGRFLRRYKRFFVDVELPNGDVLTAHCANTGSMKGCLEDGAPCRLSFHDNPRRKLQWSLEQIRVAGYWIMVNTAKPNRVVEEAVRSNEVEELQGYTIVEKERSVGKSRIDLRLSGANRTGTPPAWVEIKNATLREGKTALFPDSVTLRGLKHLEELETIVASGERGVLFFHVATEGICELRPADAIDPTYGAALRRVAERGVEVIAYRCEMDERRLWLGERVPVNLE